MWRAIGLADDYDEGGGVEVGVGGGVGGGGGVGEVPVLSAPVMVRERRTGGAGGPRRSPHVQGLASSTVQGLASSTVQGLASSTVQGRATWLLGGLDVSVSAHATAVPPWRAGSSYLERGSGGVGSDGGVGARVGLGTGTGAGTGTGGLSRAARPEFPPGAQGGARSIGRQSTRAGGWLGAADSIIREYALAEVGRPSPIPYPNPTPLP